MSTPAAFITLQQESLLAIPSPVPEQAVRRPPLDWSPPAPVWNSRPRPFQVMNEGEQYWHASPAEYQANSYRDCGPIAVAHAVNFSNAALGRSTTYNASDAIRETIADGGYKWGDQTESVRLLATTVTRLTGLQVRYLQQGPNGLDWDTALALARTRWIIVNIPGHLSVVIADRRGGDYLELVQYHVNSGGPMDAGDLKVTRDEFPKWAWQTIHPIGELWLAPGEVGGQQAVPGGVWSLSHTAIADLPTIDGTSPESFVTTTTPWAKKVEQERGYPGPILVAMASNETGYGDPRYTIEFNFFGIKAGVGWTGRVTKARTWESIGGQRYDTWADFRAYDTPADSFADFCNFLEQNSRYGGKDPRTGRYRPDWDAVGLRQNPAGLSYRDWCQQFISRIVAAGYATDPDYVTKIMSLVDRWGLAR